MRQDVLSSGIILFVIGLIMWLIGRDAYSNAYTNYQIASGLEMLGYNPNTYSSAMSFWSTFSIIGFLLFIFGIPVSIAGATAKDNAKIKFQKPYMAMTQITQPESHYREYSCIECGHYIPSNANICPYCGKNLSELKKKNLFFCSKCGCDIKSDYLVCPKCGEKFEKK